MLKKPYHIAHILPWPSIGGVEQATFRIAQAVEGERFKSVAFCLGGAAPVIDLFASSGFETAVYKAVDPSYRHPASFLRASFSLAREFRHREIDLVHCSDLLSGYYAGLAGRLAGLPVLCHIRNRFSDISRRDRSFLRAVNKFAFVSRDTWTHFGYEVASRRGVVVYDGIDIGSSPPGNDSASSVRREHGIPENSKIVGMVARVAPQKDYATLSKAAARVVAVYPNVRFLIVGDNSQVEAYRTHYEEVQRMLAADGVTDHFVFAGLRRDVPRMISAMDIFVLSTHCEGLPLVILEAMSHAKPVIATDIDGIPEIVRDEESGLLYQHEDDAHLAAHILALLRDEARAAQLGAAGCRAVEANWTREQFATSMKNLYGEMLTGETNAAQSGSVVNSMKRFEEGSPDGV